MSVKTRYLQLSETMMMEYVMGRGTVQTDASTGSGDMLYTRLADGHRAIFSPVSCEMDKKEGEYVKKPADDISTINTLNHLAVPTDKEGSRWFMFLDPDYKYCSDGNFEALRQEDKKVRSYAEYCSPAGDGLNTFTLLSTGDEEIGWDSLKIYLTSGYDFSDLFCLLARISISTKDGGMLDLCNLVLTRATAYKYVSYMTSPVIFGNFIYDKYIEIAIPSLEEIVESELQDTLNIKTGSPLKIMFSVVEERDQETMDAQFHRGLFNQGEPDKNVLCEFTKSSTIRGSIPTDFISSDNLGVYMTLSPDSPFVEFYGTWKDAPLDTETVQAFNTDIELYDRSMVRRMNSTYEVEDGYVPEYDMKKWVAMHEITCEVIGPGEKILDTENYSMTQLFTGTGNTKFHYRPTILDDEIIRNIGEVALNIDYTLRFMNIEDGVQFLKHGALSVSGNDLFRFCQGTSSISQAGLAPYKVYNRIVEKKGEVPAGVKSGAPAKTQYIKVFYNVSDITLDDAGNQYADGEYTVVLSKTPKNYKFVFRKRNGDGTRLMDMTDTYYKLYAKDSNGTDIVIDPTYSKNMNPVLGELEFYINQSVIGRLARVADKDRVFSIVAYNSDNSVSSMYDVKYSIR